MRFGVCFFLGKSGEHGRSSGLCCMIPVMLRSQDTASDGSRPVHRHRRRHVRQTYSYAQTHGLSAGCLVGFLFVEDVL